MSENIKKDIYNIHDKSYKDLYSKKEIAIDLFKSLVNEKWTEYLTPENLTLVNKSYVTADYEELEADIVYNANLNDTEVYFYILLEFQSTVDYRMPLRLLFYMCEILREHAVNAKHKKYDKNIKIPAVLPIVLYNGAEKWNVPKEFRKMIYNEELFGSGILNFTYDIVDISNDEKFNKENLILSKNVTSAIFLLDQKVDALEFLERIKVIALYFNSLSETEIKAVKNWIRNSISEKLADSAIKILESDKMEVELMVARNAFILEEMKDKAKKEGKEQGRIEGRAEGREEGRAEGKVEGRKEGIQEGRQEEKIEIAKNMKSLGIDIDTISKATGLSKEDIIKKLNI